MRFEIALIERPPSLHESDHIEGQAVRSVSLAAAPIQAEVMMTHFAISRAVAPPHRGNKPGWKFRLASGRPGIRSASNDNFSCFDQYTFERAAMRELSGDVDF